MLDIKNYIYLDEQGIESLYAQLTDEIILEQRIKATKTNTGSIKAKAGLSGLFKDLFSADIEAGGERTGSIDNEKTITYSYEQKLKKIIEITSETDNYYSSLYSATTPHPQSSSLTLINVFETFYSRLDFRSHEAFEYLYECGYLEFETGDRPPSEETKITYSVPYDTYTYSDNYYKKSIYRVVMSMKLDKMRTSWRGMTSHLAVALRGSNGKLKLGVFGQIRNVDNLYFQIKPFAVWW